MVALPSLLTRLLTISLALSLGSCSMFVNGIHATTMTFPVKPPPGATTFAGWTEVTLSQDISSVQSATLVAVTLHVKSPENTPDLSFLGSIVGSTVTPTATTQVVSLDSFPKGEEYVTLRNDYPGNKDLHPLFKDAHTIHIAWSGTLNPSYPVPAAGFEVEAVLQINIEQ